MGTSKPRVAIAGVGYWGKNLLRTFGGLESAQVTHLCDLDAGRLAAARETCPGAEPTTNFAALCRRDDVDAIVVATPPSRHHAMALEALRGGKHVWVEKPLALNVRDGKELVDAAAKAGTILFVDETFLYDPMVREMKRRVEAGELGDIMHCSFQRLGMGRIRRDSNVWWNSAPHDLSILFYLVPSAPKAVRMHLHTYLQDGVADMAVADLELENGTSAHVYLSWLNPEKVAKVIVVGRKGMLGYEGRFEQRALMRYDYRVDLTPPAPGAAAPIVPIEGFQGTKIDVPGGAEPLRLAAEHFVESIVAGTEPLTSGARSLRVVEALELAERNATRGGHLA